MEWLRKCFQKETSNKTVNSTRRESDLFEPLSRGHRHICYTDCSRVHKQLKFTFPNRQNSDHHHAATICTAQDLVTTLEEFYGLKVTVNQEKRSQASSQLCQKCEKNLPKENTLKKASMLAPPLGVK